MKSFVILAMLMTGLMFSSCEKENNVVKETPLINTFEDFQQMAGDKLVYSEELSDNEFDCYLYYAGGEDVEPTIIAQAKESADKGPFEEIRCYQKIFNVGGIIQCISVWDDCNDLGNGRMQICNWSALRSPNQQ